MSKVVNPFLKSLRGKVAFIMYSLSGREDPIRGKLYRSIRSAPPADAQRREGAEALHERLNAFSYTGSPVVPELTISTDRPVGDYFRQLPGTASDAPYNPEGFWRLPIPVNRAIEVHPADVVVYDAEGYAPLRDFLKQQGVRHVLLAGYNTDMCYKSTTAGYDNLSPDFNVFLVGDASLATFPANDSPQYATNAAISLAARDHLVTQVSWIRYTAK
jgi:nicotinamidase-related amidase